MINLLKLYTFQISTQIGRFERVGIERGNYLVDANLAVADLLRGQGYEDEYILADALAPSKMLDLLKRGKKSHSLLIEGIKDAKDSIGPQGEKIIHKMNEVRLLSPLPRPRRIHDFMVIEEHVKNSLGKIPPEWYKMPVAYKGNPDSVVGPDEPVRWPRYTEKLDYELEICAILGKKGYNVSENEAKDFIFGYSIFNDFSARDIQMREMTVGLGPFKGKDFATAIGPCIVTKDEFDPLRAKMTVRINGEVWSEGTMKEMRFDFPHLVSYLSQEEYVFPGDILGSGTMAKGSGLEINRWIKPGDTIELDVEGIGTLRNRVVRENVSS